MFHGSAGELLNFTSTGELGLMYFTATKTNRKLKRRGKCLLNWT